MKEIFEEKLKVIAGDEMMLQALKFVFDERIESEKPVINNLNDNNLLGEQYRAYIQANKLLYEVITDISSYNSKKVDSEKYNKGK